MEIENANSHPFKVAITKESGVMYANSHPYQVVIVGGGGGQEGRVVDELPEVGEPGYIYLVLKEESSEGNIYDEYMWVLQRDGETYGWEHIATTDEVEVPAVVQTTGISTEDVMSQNATTSMVFDDPSTTQRVKIGNGAIINNGAYGVAIGSQASIQVGNRSVALGYRAGVNGVDGSVALGTGASPNRTGEVNIGSYGSTAYGFNNTNYRVIGGVHDPQNDHDAATKGYVDTAIAGAGGASEINSTDWSALWQ